MRNESLLAMAAAILSSGLGAAEKTWQGGTDGASWNVAANWSPAGVPADGDSLVFDFSSASAAVTIANDLPGLEISGLKVTASQKVTLQGSSLKIAPGGATVWFDTTAEHEDLIDYDVNGGTLVYKTGGDVPAASLASDQKRHDYLGSLSGTGAFVKDGRAVLDLCGDNTAYAGVFVFTNAYQATATDAWRQSRVFVRNDKALGTSNTVLLGGINGFAGGMAYALEFMTPGTFANDIHAVIGGECGMRNNASGRVTFTGDVWYEKALRTSGAFSFAGRLRGTNPNFNDADGVWIEKTCDCTLTGWYADSGSQRVYARIGDSVGNFTFCTDVHVYTNQFMNASAVVTSGYSYGTRNGHFCLHDGADLAIRDVSFNSKNDTADKGITVSADGDSLFSITGYTRNTPASMVLINGTASFSFGGAGSLVLGGTSDTTGGFVVQSGRLTLGATSKQTALSSLTVNGGTLAVQLGAVVNPNVAVDVAASGRLELEEGMTLFVRAARIGGVALEPGEYPAAALDGLVTGGTLIVTSMDLVAGATANWTGGADDDLRTAANWEGGVTPNLTGYTTPLFFTKGTARAAAKEDAKVYGLTLSSGTPFALDGVPGTTITVMDGGLAADAADSGAAVTHTVGADVKFMAFPSQISVSGLKAGLVITGRLSSAKTVSPLYLKGEAFNTLSMTGDNRDLDVPVVISNLYTRFTASDQFGTNENSSLTVLQVPGYKNTSNSNSPLYLAASMTVPCPVTLQGSQNRMNAGGTDIHFARLFSFRDPSAPSVKLAASVAMDGGIAANGGNVWVQMLGGAHLWVTNEPVSMPSCAWQHDDYGTVHLGTSNHVMSAYSLMKGTLRLESDTALEGRFPLGVGVGFALDATTLDLNGHAAEVPYCTFTDSSGRPNSLKLTSETPAIFKIAPTGNQSCWSGKLPRIHVLGRAGLEIAANASKSEQAEIHTFTNRIDGELVVSRGAVKFTDVSMWHGSTNVTVRGGGQIVCDVSTEGRAFGSPGNGYNVKLVIEDAATAADGSAAPAVVLDGDETVRTLSLRDGDKIVPMRSGTYGGPESTARNKPKDADGNDLFGGTGVLNVVTSDFPGTMLILR